MGDATTNTAVLFQFLPEEFASLAFAILVIIGASQLVSMVYIVSMIANHNIKIGPIVGDKVFLKRKRKNMMTYKQELLIFGIHLATTVLVGLTTSISPEAIHTYMPLLRSLIWLGENIAIFMMCPELRFGVCKYRVYDNVMRFFPMLKWLAARYAYQNAPGGNFSRECAYC